MSSRSMKPIPQAIVLLWVTIVGATGIFALVRGEIQSGRSDDRDAARAYQRCEQQRPTQAAVSVLLERYPDARATVRREAPGTLDPRGHLPVPDCARIYPRGAEISHRYPDLTPTRDGP